MVEFIPAGDCGLIIRFGEQISPEINQQVREMFFRIESKKITGVIELIPAYSELLICYDPLQINHKKLISQTESLLAAKLEVEIPSSRLIEVPVAYGEEFGPDLDEVARLCRISPEGVITIHCGVEYLVYMLGFTPGFCYLGGLDSRIRIGRKANPRLKIPAGAVGIAEDQTGIYPIESPGGWQIIGRTPLVLFDPKRKPEFLFQPGDRLRFIPISYEEFQLYRQGVIIEVKEK